MLGQIRTLLFEAYSSAKRNIVRILRQSNLVQNFESAILVKLDPHTVILVAIFNDLCIHPALFRGNYRILIQLITYKFRPNVIIAPKNITYLSDLSIIRKIFHLNCEIFNLYKTLYPGPNIISSVQCT